MSDGKSEAMEAMADARADAAVRLMDYGTQQSVEFHLDDCRGWLGCYRLTGDEEELRNARRCLGSATAALSALMSARGI